MNVSKLDKLIPKKVKTSKKFPNGHPIKGQKRLNALARGAVPPGQVLNPYGKFGNCFRSRWRLGNLDHKSWRPEAMKRKRLVLKEKKRFALEMHELQNLARESASDAMKALIDITKDSRAPQSSRIAAASVILDRGYGKASQVSMSMSLNNGKAKEITGDELDKRIGQALKRVEELTKRAPKAGKSPEGPANVHKYH